MKNTLLRLFIFLLLFLLIESIIRNNRVILHDEHLINENIEEEEEEFIENNKKLKEIKIEEERRRKREINNKWENKWKNKAIKWGKTDKELIRIRFLLEQINKLIINENNTETTKNLTLEQLNELKNWKERRMNNDEIKIKKKRKGEWPEEKGEHYEGDIILNEEQLEEIIKNIKKNNNKNNKIHKRIKRKFIGSNIRRWDSKKPIIYSFDGSHTLREQKVIELALEHWHNITCLDFERKDDEPKGSRIVFTDVDGCASNVGKHPLGEPQFVSLAPECIRLGVIAHEVAHALGFWHEQSRPDRDLWVQVQWDNIDRDSKGQFLKEQPSDVDNSGVPYDYGSIMHYRSKAFAKLDDLFTIGTFISDYQKTIGQRDQLSFNDIRLMNEIYCHKVCPKQLPCQRGGYTDPRHCERCRCPDGFTGVICEQVMPGYGAECGGRIEVGNNWTIISSPNYPLEFREGQECSWLLIAPLGQKVQLQFFGEFEMYCKVRHSLCMDYVEIRNSTDFANTGMRYCCYGTPLLPIYSSTNDLLVLFRSFYRGGRGFQAKAKAINPSRNSQQQWSEWGEWTECSGNDNCGGCGIKRRNRKCILNNNNNKEEKREKDKEEEKELICLGVDTETQICSREPCKGLCSKPISEEGECHGLLSLLKGIRCQNERIIQEECNQICCSGFKLDKKIGICIENNF